MMTMKSDDGGPQKPGDGRGALRLSVALRKVLEERGEQPLTLAYLVEKTDERAIAVLIAFLLLPFMQPIPLPVLSIPFGLLVALLGVELGIGYRRPWMPQALANRRLPPKTTAVLLRAVARIFQPLERIIKPRLLFLQTYPMHLLLGLALAVDGILLAVLPPFPGSNVVPAWMAIIKVLGITEEDSICMVLGLVLTGVVVAAGVVVGVLVVMHGREVLPGWLTP